MSTKTRTREKRTDTESVPGHANYWGTDGDGDEHYWSVSEQTMFVDTDDGVEAFPMAEFGGDDLVDWGIFVASNRGLWEDIDLPVEAARRLTKGDDR